MNSISFSWKKPAPDGIKTSTRKTFSQNRRAPKIPTAKQSQNTKLRPTRKVRFEKPPPEEHSQTSFPTINLVSKSSKNSRTNIPIYNDRRLCSMRAAIVTFIIAIILIVAAGVSVGIVFAVINSQTSSGNKNNNQNSFSTISSGVLTSSVSIGSQSGPPCSAYTTINDPTRNVNLVGSTGSCDNGPLFNTSNGGAWIRFIGTGGTEIPLSSPGISHCDGFLSGWYNDTLPGTTNVITNGTVCFETYSDDCGIFVSVSVVYCSVASTNFYVYFLPPVNICNLRYCTT